MFDPLLYELSHYQSENGTFYTYEIIDTLHESKVSLARTRFVILVNCLIQK